MERNLKSANKPRTIAIPPTTPPAIAPVWFEWADEAAAIVAAEVGDGAVVARAAEDVGAADVAAIVRDVEVREADVGIAVELRLVAVTVELAVAAAISAEQLLKVNTRLSVAVDWIKLLDADGTIREPVESSSSTPIAYLPLRAVAPNIVVRSNVPAEGTGPSGSAE